MVLSDGDDDLSQSIFGNLFLNWTVLQAFSEPAPAICSDDHVAHVGERCEVVWQVAYPADLHDLIGL